MSLKRRVAKLEQSFVPDKVGLIHFIYSGMSADYYAWLQDEVAAGRLRHGTLTRNIREAGSDMTASELDAWMVEANRPADNPKPYRPPPKVEGKDPPASPEPLADPPLRGATETY